MEITIDLHVHTRYSPCARIRPQDIETIAARRGLGAVAITDHNTIRGALEVAGAARALKVIVGEEIATSQGELIGYFLKEEIAPQRSPRETIAEIRRQGGVVSIPHPFDRLRSSRLSPAALADVIEMVDLIEVFNARDILRLKDEQLLTRAFRCGVIPIVSSDAHLAFEIGRSYMLVEDFATPGEFLQHMRTARHVLRKSPFIVHLITKCSTALKKLRRNAP